jgi:UDP-galactose transporter B1
VKEKFEWPAGFLIFPCAITYLIGSMVNYLSIKKEDRVHIPQQNSAICGITVAISTLTYTYAIYLTNFPVVMMVKSCNILSVILVGVCCSRVKEHKLKLGKKKILVGVLVTVGIVMFKFFDPESNDKEKKKTEIMGIILLLVSLLADGFLPDFQAVIKSVYKPQPMEMMVQINKWVSIIAIIYSLLLFELRNMIQFMIDHDEFLLDMFLMGLLSTVGQMFVYRMIKQFKQHFPPFVITTRKIFTVGLSIIIFDHKTNFMQIFGLLLVFSIVTY